MPSPRSPQRALGSLLSPFFPLPYAFLLVCCVVLFTRPFPHAHLFSFTDKRGGAARAAAISVRSAFTVGFAIASTGSHRAIVAAALPFMAPGLMRYVINRFAGIRALFACEALQAKRTGWMSSFRAEAGRRCAPAFVAFLSLSCRAISDTGGLSASCALPLRGP